MCGFYRWTAVISKSVPSVCIQIAVNPVHFQHSHLPKCGSSKRPPKGQNQDVHERAHSCTTVITVIESSCVQAYIFQPRLPFSLYSFSYILRNVSWIVLHNLNLLCFPQGAHCTSNRKSAGSTDPTALLIPDLLFL